MSKLNQIQTAIKALDGGAFQKFADAYLKKKGYENINSLGSVLGSDKVKTGTPDTFITLPNGKYVFCEHTTTPKGLYSKCDSDIDKCFNESKTGIPITKIQEIVLCHTSELSLSETESLKSKCGDRGVILSIYNISIISHDVYDQFPILAKDHLGVSVDSGQILQPDDFIESVSKNKHSTRLNTHFHFRESELNEASQALESNDLILLTGQSGVGKTRFGLEVISKFIDKNPSYKALCVYNIAGLDLFEDLKSSLSENNDFILFVDDANRITKFDYPIHFLNHHKEDQNIKIIATVRDYAFSKILEISQQNNDPKVIKINPLTDEQIIKIVNDEYSITNGIFQERIAQLSKGNPRLAIMIAEVAIKEITLDSIHDVSDIYARYFNSVESDLGLLPQKTVLEVAAIIALFRRVDIKNDFIANKINLITNKELSEFWDVTLLLNEKEIVDVWENEVAKISDQVLATYLLYISVFKKKIVSFPLIFENFYKSNRGLFNDAFFPVINAFDFEEVSAVIKPVIINTLNEKIKEGDSDYIYNLQEDYWFIDKTKVLSFINDELRSQAENGELIKINFHDDKEESITNPLLRVLKNFKNSTPDEFRISINIIFDFANKQPAIYKQLIYLFKNSYSFTHRSWQSDYLLQKILFEEIEKEILKNSSGIISQVFLAIALSFIETNCRHHEGNDKTITMYTFNLKEVDSIRQIRSRIFRLMFENLFVIDDFKPQVLNILARYSRNNMEVNVKEIVEADSNQILNFIKTKLDPVLFEHSLIADNYFKKLDTFDIDYDKTIRDCCSTKALELYRLFTIDYSERVATKLDYQEFEKYKHQKILDYASRLTSPEVLDAINLLKQICSYKHNDHDLWQISNNVGTFFGTLVERDDILDEVIASYILLELQLRLRPIELINKLLEKYGEAKCLSLINDHEFSRKPYWLFIFYCLIPKNKITLAEADHLIGLYSNLSDPNFLIYDWDYLLKFTKFKPTIIVDVAKILLKKYISQEKWGVAFGGLFNPRDKLDLANLFKNDVSILKQSYFAHCLSDQSPDYNGEAFNQILNIDANFISEYLQWVDEKQSNFTNRYSDNRDYTFLWTRSDYKNIIDSALQVIFEQEERYYESYANMIFGIHRHSKTAQFTEQQNIYLINVISERFSDVEYMAFIFDLINFISYDNKIPFIKKFIELNTNIADFKLLTIIYSRSWSGSRVPILEEDLDFLNKLLPLFNTVHLLDHRSYVESLIDKVRDNIKSEKKRDFLEE